MKIMAIGAHADDIELGCGGTVLKFAEERDNQIHFLVATNSEYRNPEGALIRSAADALLEAQNTAASVNAELKVGDFNTFELVCGAALNEFVRSEIDRVQPELILCHWPNDAHSDHRELGKSVIHSARHVQKVLFYMSNWYVSEQSFAPNYFVNIDDQIEKKVALLKLFHSEFDRVGERWEQQVRHSAGYWGLQADATAAEAFVCHKWVWQ